MCVVKIMNFEDRLFGWNLGNVIFSNLSNFCGFFIFYYY